MSNSNNKKRVKGTQLTLSYGIKGITIRDMIPGKSWFQRDGSPAIYCRIGETGAIGINDRRGVYYFSLGGKISLDEPAKEIKNMNITFDVGDKTDEI